MPYLPIPMQSTCTYIPVHTHVYQARLWPFPKRRPRLQLRLDRARLLYFNTGRRADLDIAVAEVVVSDTAYGPHAKS